MAKSVFLIYTVYIMICGSNLIIHKLILFYANWKYDDKITIMLKLLFCPQYLSLFEGNNIYV